MKIAQVFTVLFLALTLTVSAQVKQDRNVGSFHSIEASGSFIINIRMGNESALTIVAEEDMQSRVKAEVSNGELSLALESDWTSVGKNEQRVVAYITVAELHEIELSGACEIQSKNTLVATNLELDASGACKMSLDIAAQEVTTDFSGAIKAELRGKTNKLVIEGSGASTVLAAYLLANSVIIDVSGASQVEVRAKEKLKIDASGAAKVVYFGNPAAVEQDTSGAVRITKK